MDKVFGKHSTGKTNTPIGRLVDLATDAATNKSENWAMFMEVCDAINATAEGPKDAAKAIRRRFQVQNSTTITFTLALLETCVKNCGKRFHLQVAHKEFLQDMIKVTNPKNSPPLETQIKVLSLIQTWAYAFNKDPELKEVNKAYSDLKTKGVEFPPIEPDQASAANIPSHSAPTVVPTNIKQARPSQNPVSSSPGSSSEGAVREMTAERAAKLHAELQTVQQNCRVFSDLLTEASSGNSTADLDLLEDLNGTCRKMQVRMQELLVKIQNEQITGELLTVNDELNNVFLRYDRFQRMRAGREGGEQPLADNSAEPIYASISHQDNAGNLIDIDDSPASQQPGFVADFANMGLHGGPPLPARESVDGMHAIRDSSVPLNDKESDYLEMQKWLLENPSTRDSTAGSGGGASASSLDFDQFLARRQEEVEKLPSVNQSASRNMSKAESSSVNNNEPLFSL